LDQEEKKDYDDTDTDTDSDDGSDDNNDDDEDPCHGKPKEFFRKNPLSNVILINLELSNFLLKYYPEHYDDPEEMIIYLYKMAIYREEMREFKRQEALRLEEEAKREAAKQKRLEELRKI
jgi:hypothetical protein